METNIYKPCCPEFKPERFDGKEHVWQGKTFIKDSIVTFMHMPINMHSVMLRMWNKIKKAEASPADEDFLMLCYDPSLWKTELYMTTTKIIPEAENVAITGKFISKVFDGQYKEIPKFIKEMEMAVALKGKAIERIYIHYAYCPKCVQHYKHNYMIFFAKIAE